MKVEAYRCDWCKQIREVDEMTGVLNTTDLWETSLSYPVSKTPCKAAAHFCLDCYRINVEIIVKNKMFWREGEKYDAEREKQKRELLREFTYIFKKEVIRRNNEDSVKGKRR